MMVGRSSTASVRGGGEEECEVWGGSECGAGGSPDVEHESEDDDGDLHVQEEVREEGVERLSFEKLDDCNYAEQTEGLLFPALHLAHGVDKASPQALVVDLVTEFDRSSARGEEVEVRKSECQLSQKLLDRA